MCNISGKFLIPGYFGTNFHKLLKKATLPLILFHDLRHTTASLLLSMEVNAKVVQKLLSHINMTLGTYTHVLLGMHEEAMEKMENLFGNLKDSEIEEGKAK